MYKLGILGGGNMAQAIVNGIIKVGFIKPSEILISDIDSTKLELYAKEGISVTKDNRYLFANCEYILFAVKPQIFKQMDSIHAYLQEESKLISIMAGISIASILKKAGRDIAVSRIMPNTPCMIGSGMSVLTYHRYDDISRRFVKSIFDAIGETAEMDERLFDAVTSISGSGPAYVYTFIDAMVKGGMEGGLSLQESRKLALATLKGAAEMVRINEDKPIGELIDAVCSKGGTTIEAVNTFKENNLTEIIIKGINACRKRSEELS